MGVPPRPVPLGARRPAVLAAAALMVGIFSHRILPHHATGYLAFTALFVITAAINFRKTFVCSALMTGAIFFLGIALAQVESFHFPANDISAYAADEPRLAFLELYINDPPRVVKNAMSNAWAVSPKQVTTATVTQVKTIDGWEECAGKILVQIEQPHPYLAVGQTIRVVGLLERPGTAMNPGQFDWAKYYREQRILASVRISHSNSIQVVHPAKFSPLEWLRERARHALAAGFPAKKSLDHALLRALVLGDSDPELRDIQEDFRRTGTSHHLAISGMHIAVLGGLLFFISRLLRRPPRFAIWAALSFVIIYGLVALPSPPVVRSVLLCIAFAIGMLNRRSTDPIQLLALSVIAMLIYHPLDLYNAGFQLSFGTVLGLMVFTRLATRAFFPADVDQQIARSLTKQTRISEIRWRIRRSLQSTLVAGVVAWLVSMPLLAFHFEQLNPWAIAASILLAPIVLAALIGGFFKILLTLLLPSLASPLASIAAFPIAAMRHALHLLAKMPGSDVPFPTPSLWFIAGYYALLCTYLIPWQRPTWRRSFRLGPAVALAMLVMLPFTAGFTRSQPQGLRATTLAVGAGSCCVVKLPDGKTILIDDGSSSVADLLRKLLGPYLRHDGTSHIDALFVSHANYDHFSATTDLVNSDALDRIYLTPYFRKDADGNPFAEEMLEALDRQAPPTIIAANTDVAMKDVNIHLLWPPADQPIAGNESSMVLRMTYAKHTILFTGDIQDIAMRELLKNPNELGADVLIAPHHGSSERFTDSFVKAVNPSIIISSNDRTLSGKQRNFDRLVANRTLYRTNRYGAITAQIDPNGRLHVDTFLHPKSK